jgi:hypothetical protein
VWPVKRGTEKREYDELKVAQASPPVCRRLLPMPEDEPVPASTNPIRLPGLEKGKQEPETGVKFCAD